MNGPADRDGAGGTDPGCSAVLGQAGASVALRASSPAILAGARQSLYCYQERPRNTAACWQVDVAWDPAVSDPGAAVTPRAAGAGRPLLDVGPGITTRACGSSEDWRAFWVPALATLVTVAPGRRIIRARCAGEDAARYWACSLTRQAMTSQQLAAGMIYAHAAAFTCAGRGIVVAGHKGRGKTTTLLASLHRLGGDYVTGDRLLLHADGQHVHGYPWPQPLRAGLGTLASLPHLAGLLPAAWRGVPAADLRALPDKIVIEPSFFPRVLAGGGTVADRLTCDVMIWPQLDPGCRHARAERVPPAEVLRTVTRTQMFMTCPERGTRAHTNHWLAPAPPGRITDSNLARAAAALAAAPCYRIRAGADPAALAAVVGSVLAELP